MLIFPAMSDPPETKVGKNRTGGKVENRIALVLKFLQLLCGVS
jgi:hypothetical protein